MLPILVDLLQPLLLRPLLPPRLSTLLTGSLVIRPLLRTVLVEPRLSTFLALVPLELGFVPGLAPLVVAGDDGEEDQAEGEGLEHRVLCDTSLILLWFNDERWELVSC